MRISRTILAANARSFALLSLVLGAASLCSADEITYNVNLTIGAGGVTGDIVTDGTIGVISMSNVVDWNLILTTTSTQCFGQPCTVDLLGPVSDPSGSSQFISFGADLTATATQLQFDFSETDLGFAYFRSTSQSIVAGVCFFDPTRENCFSPNPSSGEQLVLGDDSEFTSLTGTQVIGTASSSAGTPEPSTLPLLGVGIALLGLSRLGIKQQRSR
jgi:hypothetical protein